MAFTRDFDNSAPIDHTLNSAWPLQIRSFKNDLVDRLGDIISGFNSGETVKGVKALPFIAVTKPGTITDQIQLFGKDISGKTELCAVDEDGNEIQITKAGALNTTPLATILNTIYPVGIVVTLGVSTDPATLFGIGTWTKIEGKVIVGISAADTEFDTLNETGGEKTHVLTITEMPAHTHTVPTHDNLNNTSTPYVTSNANSTGSATTSSAGGNGAHNNLQPYIVKYVWERTA